MNRILSELTFVIVFIGIVGIWFIPLVSMMVDNAQCRRGQDMVEAAALQEYEKSTLMTPKFPATMDVSFFDIDQIPFCPFDGDDIAYNSDGTASCPNSIANHSRTRN